MKTEELITALRGLKIETGSLACLGCGYENNCSIHGCAILREAEELALLMGRCFNEETMKKMLGVPEWVPVNERMPEDRVRVLTCDAHGNMHILSTEASVAFPFFIHPHNTRYYPVTHWMPLPEPPKEVASDAGD